MPAKSSKDIYWVSGIIEGEGTFSVLKGCATLKVGMTDIDTINRVREILGNKNSISIDYSSKKPVYITRLHGIDAISWMMTIYDLMSERRKCKIREIINIWRNHVTIMGRKVNVPGSMCKNGHIISGENIMNYTSYKGKNGIRCRICYLKTCNGSPEYYILEIRRLEGLQGREISRYDQ